MDTQKTMLSLESMLLQSIQQYENILDCMQQMDVEVGTADSIALEHFSTSLQTLQEQAIQFDRIILSRLHRKPIDNVSIQNLCVRRDDLMKDVLLLNKRISEKALRVKSLLAHEMGKLRNGFSALNGYKSPQHNQGRIVNGTS